MFGSQDIPLFLGGDVGVYLCRHNGAMSQELLYVADIHILLQQKCGKGVPEHMGRDVQMHPGKVGIFLNHKSNRLV